MNTTTVKKTENALCARCRSAPPLVPAMRTCKACLQKQVAFERAQRERRMRDWAKDQRRARRASP